MLLVKFANANSIFFESFEYANHDGESPIGWTCDDDSWLCGYLYKDHNRIAHSGNWYAYTNADESWMFMEMFMSTQLKYRYNFWAISDGDYDLEIWAGNGNTAEAMSHLLLSCTVNGGNYHNFSEYIASIPSDYQYFGIHATAHEGAYHLTIDDFNVDMVDKYGLQVLPDNLDTTMAAGTQTEFKFKFQNVGYEPLTVYVTPNSEFFTDIHIRANGVECTSFPAEPDEIVEISGIATMLPTITAGSLCWIDIMFWLDCGCATAMFTLWATAETTSIDENFTEISIFPNPSTGNVTINGKGHVTVSNSLGQIVFEKEIIEKETLTLEKGIYFVKLNNSTRKIVVR